MLTLYKAQEPLYVESYKIRGKRCSLWEYVGEDNS